MRWGARQRVHAASWLLWASVLAMGWPCCTVGAERETACGWANTRNTGAHVPPRSLVLSSPAVLQLRGGGKQKPDVTTGGEAPKPGLDVAYCATVSVPLGSRGLGVLSLLSL